jgi:hypothetical protein
VVSGFGVKQLPGRKRHGRPGAGPHQDLRPDHQRRADARHRRLSSSSNGCGAKAARTTATLPVILVTGHTRTSQIFKLRDAGQLCHVAKPITPKVLLERIVWVAARRAAVHRVRQLHRARPAVQERRTAARIGRTAERRSSRRRWAMRRRPICRMTSRQHDAPSEGAGMSVVRKFRAPNRLSMLVKERGGMMAKDAIAAAEAALETLRARPRWPCWTQTIAEIERRFGKTAKATRARAPSRTSITWRCGSSTWGSSSADSGVDKAAISLCALVDSLRRGRRLALGRHRRPPQRPAPAAHRGPSCRPISAHAVLDGPQQGQPPRRIDEA